MKKSKYYALIKEYQIDANEVGSICDFVSELLHRKARELEKDEPYATRSIAELDRAAHEVWELNEYIEELEEEE